MWWDRHCKPSWLGDQTHSRGWNFDTSQPPRRILVQEAPGFRAVAYSESVYKHRGRWMPRIRLGTATDKHWPTASIADPYVILHEVAHIMVGCDEGCGDTGHGRWFRYYHVLLVTRWMGPEYGRALKAGYEAEGLKWRKPQGARKPPPAQPDYHGRSGCTPITRFEPKCLRPECPYA